MKKNQGDEKNMIIKKPNKEYRAAILTAIDALFRKMNENGDTTEEFEALMKTLSEKDKMTVEGYIDTFAADPMFDENIKYHKQREYVSVIIAQLDSWNILEENKDKET